MSLWDACSLPTQSDPIDILKHLRKSCFSASSFYITLTPIRHFLAWLTHVFPTDLNADFTSVSVIDTRCAVELLGVNPLPYMPQQWTHFQSHLDLFRVQSCYKLRINRGSSEHSTVHGWKHLHSLCFSAHLYIFPLIYQPSVADECFHKLWTVLKQFLVWFAFF